ncbi:hypothetical protein N310_13769, partial [Acanthisitta chloris]
MTKHCGHFCNQCLWGRYFYNRHIDLQTDIVCCRKCQPLCCSASRKEHRRVLVMR